MERLRTLIKKMLFVYNSAIIIYILLKDMKDSCLAV
jgi:hypothetical protein